jgi:hypothetical protein
MTYEKNGYDDSDFYAVVYDAETDSLKRRVRSTRGYTTTARPRSTRLPGQAKAREVAAGGVRSDGRAAAEAAKAPKSARPSP